jgi:hypothetical protein
MARLERDAEGLPSRVNGQGRASLGSPAPATPQAAAKDTLDVGEQIRRLQALVELRASGILTQDELLDLKRGVLSPESAAPQEAQNERTVQASRPGEAGSAAVTKEVDGRAPSPSTRRNGKPPGGASPVSAAGKKASVASRGAPRPQLNRREPKSTYVTTLKVEGTIPITYNAGGNKRPSYVVWKKALSAAAAEAATAARPVSSELFSLRIQLRLYSPGGPGSDLDNYVKPIQDALAERGVFGPTTHKKSTMKGDEHVDHLDLRRLRVKSAAKAGVVAEVWALDP